MSETRDQEHATNVIAAQLAKKNVTPEVIAGYEMIQGAVTALAFAAERSEAAKNYVEIMMVGVPLPFDRAAIHLIRPGGMTPHEMREAAERELGGMRVQLRHAKSDVENRERALEQLREKVARLEAELAAAWAGQP